MAALTTDGRALSRPMIVEEIILKAESFNYNPHIEFKYYLRTANTLLKEVCRNHQLLKYNMAHPFTGGHLRTRRQ